MNIKEELKKYTHLATIEKLEKHIEMPLSLCPGELKYIIPSIVMGSDGPVLDSLFLMMDNSLCEVRLQNTEFDYVSLKIGFFNYRVVVSEHIVKREGKDDLKYELAKITLAHGNTISFRSEFNYVGNDREEWLKLVFEALPTSIILRPCPTEEK